MDSPPRFKLTRLFWIGLALLVLGTGPLLLIIAAAEVGLLSDPNPNPIGPRLLAFFTFWPAVIMIAWGLIASLVRYRRAQTRFWCRPREGGATATHAALAASSLSFSSARFAAGREAKRAT
jgi:hypothetical protein